MDMEDILGDNGSIILLQIFIVILAGVIMVLLYSERTNTHSMNKKLDDFKCPECPKCPNCPACNCAKEGCPDCVCPKAEGCPKCPACADCPKCETLTPEDIADAMFPGRNKGITMHGKYFPLTGLDEKHIMPAFTESKVGGGSGYAPVTFDSSVTIAARKAPPIGPGKGVFTPKETPKPSAVGGAGPGERAGTATGTATGAAAGAASVTAIKPVTPATPTPASAPTPATGGS